MITSELTRYDEVIISHENGHNSKERATVWAARLLASILSSCCQNINSFRSTYRVTLSYVEVSNDAKTTMSFNRSCHLLEAVTFEGKHSEERPINFPRDFCNGHVSFLSSAQSVWSPVLL